MKESWQLQEAKNKFSQVVANAVNLGPQAITVHGKETAVVMSMDDYRRLIRGRTNLVDFFRKSPLAGGELDLARSPDTGRDVDL